MFYDQFISICQMNNKKPSPVLKELGLSPGNLGRWQNGGSVNYDILQKLSAYFKVPVDYFFQDNNQVLLPPDPKTDEKEYASLNLFYIFRAHSELVSSILNGGLIDPFILDRISIYMGYPKSFFLPQLQESTGTEDYKGILTDNELILTVLADAAGNNDYRYFQVQISRIILTNLEKLGYGKSDLRDLKLYDKKLDNLYDHEVPPASCIPLNSYNIIKIAKGLHVSLTYMFTGKEEKDLLFEKDARIAQLEARIKELENK